MSKLYVEPIEVALDQDGGPRSFIWRKHVYQVTGYKVEKQPFSYSFRPPPRRPDRYRCETKQGLVCELVKQEDGWVLERVWD
jgi:hypothetical protein